MPSTGTITGSADTKLVLGSMVLPAGSVVSSAGDVELDGVTDERSYSVAGATVTYGATFTGPVLDLGSSLDVAAGSANFAPAVDGPANLTTGAITVARNSTLTGTDSFTADGMLSLVTGARLSVSGTVNAEDGLDLDDGDVTIQSTTLNNSGTATWYVGPSGFVQLESGATINNLAGATFVTTGASYFGSVGINAGDGSAVAFNNAGTFVSAAPPSFNVFVPFANSGSVVVDEGSLNISSFNNSGTVTVASGASFNGSGSPQPPIIVSSGETLTTSPNETINSDVVLAGGTLDITGPLMLDGMLALGNGSTLEGTGSVDAAGGLYITGDGAISAATLNNDGRAIWDQNTLGSQYTVITLSAGAAINNLAGSTFTAVGLGSTGEIVAGDGSAVGFNNDGTLLIAPESGGGTSIGVAFSQAGAGTTDIQQRAVVALTGDCAIAGSLTADAGAELNFAGTGSVSGSVVAGQGSLVLFVGGAMSLDTSSSLTSAGIVYIEAPVTVEGNYDVTGSTQDNGRLTFTAPVTDLGTDLDLLGTLDIATAQSFDLASLEVTGGSLIGPGSGGLTVTGSMTWNGGVISGLGTLTVASGAVLSAGGSRGFMEILDATTLDIAGTATLTSADSLACGIDVIDSAGIDIQSGGSFTIQDAYDSVYISSDSSPTFFTNEGSLVWAGSPSSNPTLIFTLGSPNFSQIQSTSFKETSTGSMAVGGGYLQFDGTESISGSVSASARSMLFFNGPSTTFDGSSNVTSAGTVALGNATSSPAPTTSLGRRWSIRTMQLSRHQSPIWELSWTCLERWISRATNHWALPICISRGRSPAPAET